MKRHIMWPLIFGLLLISAHAKAKMVAGSSIGNDPAKEQLCASRANGIGKTVPFEIDSRYVAAARAEHPDTTFIAVDGMSPQLVECFLREGTGRYEPNSYSPEQAYWHTIKPEGVGIDTEKARSKAAKACLDAALSKENRSGLDHSVNTAIFEIDINRAGTSVAGEKAERYDIAVEGTSFYKSAGPDLTTVKFTCLLTRALRLRAIQFE